MRDEITSGGAFTSLTIKSLRATFVMNHATEIVNVDHLESETSTTHTATPPPESATCTL